MAYSNNSNNSNRELRQREFAAGRRYKSEDTQNYNPDGEFVTEKRFSSDNHIYSSDYRDNNLYTGDNKPCFLGAENYTPRTNAQSPNYNNDSGYEGTEDQTYSARGKRFRRMVSSASLQSQVIPEDPHQPSYLTRQQRHALTRVASYPSRLVAANHTPVNNPYPTRQDRTTGLRNRNDISKHNHVNGGGPHHAWRHPSPAPPSSYWAPTLLVCFILSLGLCYICYTLAHVVPLTQEIPTVHSGEQIREAESHDYMAVYMIKIGHVNAVRGMDFVREHWWLVGPVTVGITVTLVTLKILHYDSIGGPKVKPAPSLHLGNVVAVLNGILMCLYFLFYNLKVKPAEEARSK